MRELTAPAESGHIPLLASSQPPLWGKSPCLGQGWPPLDGSDVDLDATYRLVAARFDTESGRVLDRRVLFEVPPGVAGRSSWYASGLYDITPDDQRFLMARTYQGPAADPVDAADEPARPRVILVNNFFTELRARVGG